MAPILGSYLLLLGTWPMESGEGLTPGPRLGSGQHVIVSRGGGGCLAGSVWAFWSGGDPKVVALIVMGRRGGLSAVSAWAPEGRGRARTVQAPRVAPVVYTSGVCVSPQALVAQQYTGSSTEHMAARSNPRRTKDV